jgi:hypothetical protein
MKFPREFYIPRDSVELADPGSDAVAYLWFAGNGKPGFAVFYGKQAKPVSNFYYSSYARMDEALARAFEGRRASMAYKAERKEKRKAFQHEAKVGDIYRTSWGYEQTNVEYFEIIEIKGKHAILREIAVASESTGFMSGRCAPLPGKFLEPRHEGDDRGSPIRRLIQDGYIKICDVRHAWPEKPKMVAGVPVFDSAHWSNYH